ncbi:MAG TPA: hypothetical protein VD813_07495 [Pseudonocardia sp.]|nr:hypothetical protein [Pseudonocardia sp.]
MDDRRHVDVGTVDLYGLIEQLVRSEPRAEDANPGTGAAGGRDALAAIAELARAIEVPAQAGDLDPEQAHRMATLLLVVRDFVRPVGTDADEQVRRYLAEVLERMHHSGRT